MLRNNSEIIAELNFCSTAIHGRSAADVSPAYAAALTRPVRESSYLDIKVRYTKRLIIHAIEHSNSGKNSLDSIRFSLPNRFFDSIRQSDKFAACTLIFK